MEGKKTGSLPEIESEFCSGGDKIKITGPHLEERSVVQASENAFFSFNRGHIEKTIERIEIAPGALEIHRPCLVEGQAQTIEQTAKLHLMFRHGRGFPR